MSITPREKFKSLSFNNPAKGYIFDLSRRCFAKVPEGINSLVDFINELTNQERNGNAFNWYKSLDWKDERELASPHPKEKEEVGG